MVDQPSERFVELVVTNQRRLYGYILTLLPNADQASEVLQQTNLVLWRDAERFSGGTNFLAWACRVAYFQVLDYRERVGRDRLRFDPQLLESLAQEAAADVAAEEAQLSALKTCLEQLIPSQRALLEQRYCDAESVQKIAAASGRTSGAVANTLHRIRQRLLACIERKLAAEGRS